MARTSTAFFGFNRGLISKLALARVDLKRIAFAAETMNNWIPRVLGSMMFRPGLGYLGSTADNLQARFLPFVFSTDDLALVEITDGLLRVWLDEEVITRAAVSTAVLNGDFTVDLANWTNADEAGGSSAWVTGGYMGLVGDGTDAAIRRQQVTVAVADQNVNHGIHIVVSRGPVEFKAGSTAGGDEYFTTTTLDTGIHSLEIIPAGDFWLEFSSTLERTTLVDSVEIETAGAMELNAPWGTTDLQNIRADQSGDILFVACKNFLQRKIERRTSRSWSLVWYLSDNGPYLVENDTETTLAPSATSGNVTLTASRAVFFSGHVGCLFKIRSEGQSVSSSISAENTFTNYIQVTGTGEERRFTITLSGTWTGTVTLQRSIGSATDWKDVTTYTANQAITYADGLPNQDIYYRIGVKTGDYGSGTVVASLDYPLGSITGVCRITGYTSETSVTAEVLTDFGGTTASKYWSEGSWSTVSGFPSAVAFYEGRLWWAGKNGIYGSVSDDFYNFNPDTVGDSGPINRTVGSGPVDDINWLLALQQLTLGAEGAEFVSKASTLDEILTPTNFNIKETSTLGSRNVQPVKIDTTGMFVHRGGTRIFELAFDVGTGSYKSNEATLVVPRLGDTGFVHLAVQRLPDTRIHCVRGDGKVAMLVYNPVENVLCWVTVETDGIIEDVVVLPGDVEDTVYYVVQRTIDGATKRYLEKWALESEARGATVTNTSDSFINYSGAATNTITGLDHLEGEEVVVWGNGKDLGTKTVTGGQIDTLPEPVTTATVGLAYTAQWKSTKLSHALQDGEIQLTYHKRVSQLGFVLEDAYPQSLQFGPDFDTLDDMPLYEDSEEVGDEVQSTYDQELIEFPGSWSGDSRVCIQAASPRPVTVLAAVLAYDVAGKE